MLYPLLFERNHHAALWGGEEWLVSGHHSSPSVIANGSLRGQTLEDVVKKHGRVLMGAKAPVPDKFPLLFKIIDAHDRLSVQVHPNDDTASSVGGEPKTEMWYILDHHAPIYAGFKVGIAKTDVVNAICDGKVEELLNKLDMAPGRSLFIPGGQVHAIGEGSLIYEVQQSSDTTYRMYDWGRVGADGKPRTLHVQESLAVIDCSLPTPIPQSEVNCSYFNFAPWRLSSALDIPGDPDTFRVLYAAEGAILVKWDNGEIQLGKGCATLIPANLSVRIEPDGSALVLATSL